MKRIALLLFFVTAISCTNDEIVNETNSQKQNEIIHEKLSLRELENKMKSTGYSSEDFKTYNSEITKSETYQIHSSSNNTNEYFVDYFEDPIHDIITYSFITQELDTNGFLEKCVTTIENGEITMGYLRYYPVNGVFTDEFTGKLEVMNMSRTEISTSNFSNFEYIPENKTSGISVDCFRTFKIISRNCSHGGNHKLGESCANGLVNDAYIRVVDLTDCKTTITSDIYQMPNAIIDINPGRGGGGNSNSSSVKWNQFYNNLNDIKTDWLDKNENYDLKNEIKSFLNLNNYSNQSITKANEIISFLSSDNILKANNTYLAKFIQNKLLFSSTLNYTAFINFWNNLTTAEKNVFANYANENSSDFLGGISIKAGSFFKLGF